MCMLILLKLFDRKSPLNSCFKVHRAGASRFLPAYLLPKESITKLLSHPKSIGHIINAFFTHKRNVWFLFIYMPIFILPKRDSSSQQWATIPKNWVVPIGHLLSFSFFLSYTTKVFLPPPKAHLSLSTSPPEAGSLPRNHTDSEKITREMLEELEEHQHCTVLSKRFT